MKKSEPNPNLAETYVGGDYVKEPTSDLYPEVCVGGQAIRVRVTDLFIGMARERDDLMRRVHFLEQQLESWSEGQLLHDGHRKRLNNEGERANAAEERLREVMNGLVKNLVEYVVDSGAEHSVTQDQVREELTKIAEVHELKPEVIIRLAEDRLKKQYGE
jgi:hypothetical protein